jgi:hypothetical protein
MMSDKRPLVLTETATWCQTLAARPGKAAVTAGVPAYEAMKPALELCAPEYLVKLTSMIGVDDTNRGGTDAPV